MAPRPKSEGCTGWFNEDIPEAGRFQPRPKCLWIDQDHRIPDVDQAHAEARQAIRAGENTSRL
jgi:hypothetical protein